MTTDPTGAPHRIAVVTGASSGIGLEIARELLARGFDLLVTAEDDRLGRAAAELALTGARVDAVRADLTTPDGLHSLVEDDLAVVALDVVAPVHVAKRLVPPMVERGEGRVLVTSSVAATMPGPSSPRSCPARRTRRSSRRAACRARGSRAGPRTTRPASRATRSTACSAAPTRSWSARPARGRWPCSGRCCPTGRRR